MGRRSLCPIRSSRLQNSESADRMWLRNRIACRGKPGLRGRTSRCGWPKPPVAGLTLRQESGLVLAAHSRRRVTWHAHSSRVVRGSSVECWYAGYWTRGTRSVYWSESEASAEKVSALGAESVRGKLTDPTTWQHAIAGCDVVFHLAAETGVTADRARHELVTIQGTEAAIPELDADTAAREVPVPVRWFLGQPCILRTDNAVTELGYEPVVAQSGGLEAVRDALAVRNA